MTGEFAILAATGLGSIVAVTTLAVILWRTERECGDLRVDLLIQEHAVAAANQQLQNVSRECAAYRDRAEHARRDYKERDDGAIDAVADGDDDDVFDLLVHGLPKPQPSDGAAGDSGDRGPGVPTWITDAPPDPEERDG